MFTSKLQTLRNTVSAQTDTETLVRQHRLPSVDDLFAEEFALGDSTTAKAAGLFGEGIPAPELPFRIGILLDLARGANPLWQSDKTPKLKGRHGGLTPEEMLMTLRGACLDALEGI